MKSLVSWKRKKRMTKNKKCWICKRTNQEVYDELIALKHQGIWKAGYPENKLIEKVEEDRELIEPLVDNILICVICKLTVESLADLVVSSRTNEDLVTEKDLKQLKVNIKIAGVYIDE